MREQSIKYDLCQVVYDDTIEDGFHGFVTQSFASAIVAVSIEIWSKRIVIFFTVKPKRKFTLKTEQNQTKKHGKSLEKVVAQTRRQKPQ